MDDKQIIEEVLKNEGVIVKGRQVRIFMVRALQKQKAEIVKEIKELKEKEECKVCGGYHKINLKYFVEELLTTINNQSDADIKPEIDNATGGNNAKLVSPSMRREQDKTASPSSGEKPKSKGWGRDYFQPALNQPKVQEEGG